MGNNRRTGRRGMYMLMFSQAVTQVISIFLRFTESGEERVLENGEYRDYD